MFHKVFILLALASTGLHANFIGSRIVGGDSATTGIAPYLVSIQNISWVHECAGAIIDTRWVLTSATCTLNENIRNVVAGVSTLIDGKAPEIAYHISRATPHPDFIEGESYNDIGIIKTLQTFVYSTTVKALPWATSTLGSNTQLTIIGWDFSPKASDSTVTPKPTSYRLRSLTFTSLTNDQCQKDAEDNVVIENSHLCGLRSTGKGTCYGDDGLVVTYGGRIQGIVGGAPDAISKCALGYPELFTRVSSFNSWIYAERSKN